ncbi:MAG: hypothetical protein H6505_03120 [Calditrichaeota bacterium]|nr:hypothetical protein [Calditrichota bacterium]
MKQLRWIPAALAALMMTMAVLAEVDFNLVTQQAVTDAREIQVLRDELFLGNETIERILITDLLNDGFDQNDAVVIYPTGRVLRLEPISERLDSLLRSFQLPPNTEIYEGRQYHTVFDSVSIVSRGGKALGYGLLGGLQERLTKGYRGNEVEGYFRFSGNGAQIRLWNFDSTRVSFPRPEPSSYDTVIVYVRDTVFVPEIVTVEKDPVVIRDTVYLPSELLETPRGLFYREALGMLGGGYNMSKREASRGHLAFAAGNEWEFGVWDRWIAGRQEVNSRIGLRFAAQLAPWKTDTLSARFLSTAGELMYIPAWDRSLFAFAGIRTYFHDNLFWDRVRAGWDDNLFDDPAEQDLGHYELAVKAGFDKLAPYGAGKKIGVWMRAAATWPGADKSRYVFTQDVQTMTGQLATDRWTWEMNAMYDVEGNVNIKLSDQTQLMGGVGLNAIPELTVLHHALPGTPEGHHNAFSSTVFSQSVALRWTILSATTYRLRIEGGASNFVLSSSFKETNDDSKVLQPYIEDLFFPYIEAPMIDGSLQLDIDIVQANLGVKAYLPDGEDAQIRPWAGVYFLFK